MSKNAVPGISTLSCTLPEKKDNHEIPQEMQMMVRGAIRHKHCFREIANRLGSRALIQPKLQLPSSNA
jgi:hypothetical protein